MIPAIMLALAAFLIVAVMLSRQTSKTKKSAIADLEAERESIGNFDIFDLVESEIDALGLLEIDGARDIPHGVLLKVWTDNKHIVATCEGRDHLHYVVAEGIEPNHATDTDVTLVCSQMAVEEDLPQPTDES